MEYLNQPRGQGDSICLIKYVLTKGTEKVVFIVNHALGSRYNSVIVTNAAGSVTFNHADAREEWKKLVASGFVRDRSQDHGRCAKGFEIYLERAGLL